MAESRFRVPHTLVLLFAMIVAATLLTYVIPQGAFERTDNAAGREVVIAGSYHAVDAPKVSPWIVFTSIPRGFEAAAEIIFFVFLVGGFFAVLRATGAIDAAIGVLLDRLGDYPALLVFGGMLVFSAGSATIGMAEEYLPFVPVLIALCIGLGLDAVTAIGILCVGYGVGYGAAAINPFTVMIAQDVAGLRPGSGLGLRVVLWSVFLAVGFQHVWGYARRVRDDASASLVADIEPDPALARREHPPMNGTHVAVLLVTVAALVWMIYGLVARHWYLHEMGALFVALSLVLGAMARLGPDTVAKEFCTGAAELTTTALLIGFARSIQIVLDDGQVVDTIIYGISLPLERLGPAAAAVGMFFVQSLCNLFIPSGSGQAYVTMPLMAPLSDLLGIHRQIAVLAYQFGDGFTNILVPTNPVLVGILTMARIPYDRWLKFIVPFMLKIWAVGSVALALAVVLGYE